MKLLVAVAAACVSLALTSLTVIASTSVGVFAIVDDVSFEPAEGPPERVRISGVFVVPLPVSSGLHQPPTRGHLYFTMDPAIAPAIRKDWADLKAVAGTGQVVGFGQYWARKPHPRFGMVNSSLEIHVRADGDALFPEPYPVPHQEGVVKTFDTEDDTSPRFGETSTVIIARLREVYGR